LIARSDDHLSPPDRAYVDTPVDWIRPHPLRFTGATLRIFSIQLEQRAAQDLCDRLFRGPSGGAVAVEPLLGRALVVFAEIAEGRSVPELGDGFLTEREFTIFLPVRVRGADFSIGVVVPFSIVSDPVGVIAGRELFGFPKLVGAVQEVRTPRLKLQASTPALATFGSGQCANPQIVVEVEKHGPSRPSPRLLSGVEAWRELQGFLTEPGAPVPVELGALSSPKIRCLFLRQLRDVSDPAKAAFQELLGVPVSITHFRGARLYRGPYEIRFAGLARPDVCAWVGLPPSQTTQLMIEVEIDFEFGRGTAL
jgi:hypothetical protein